MMPLKPVYQYDYLLYNKAKLKGDKCCTGPPTTNEIYNPCSYYGRDKCGLFGSYGEVWSKCCETYDGWLGVLVCDEDKVGLTSISCKRPYVCVQHWDEFGGPDGKGGPYARCENPDL
jgi:hypothetical protein